jgi:hypothetical protein
MMPVGNGSVGDIIAIIGVVREFASAAQPWMEPEDRRQNIKRFAENWMGWKRRCYTIINCCKHGAMTLHWMPFQINPESTAEDCQNASRPFRSGQWSSTKVWGLIQVETSAVMWWWKYDGTKYTPYRADNIPWAFSPRYNKSTGNSTSGKMSPNKSSWSISASQHSERRNAYSYRASCGDSDSDEYKYEDHLVDGMIYRGPVRCNPPPRKRRQASSTPQQPHTARPTTRKKPPPPLKATEADARKHRIPLGYSFKNWDPTEEPILLLGSVFDGNSPGN